MPSITSQPSLEAVAPFLPLIYVAWADGELDNKEIAAVRDAAQAALGAEGAADVRRLLDRWLDPDQPPNAVELALLLDGIAESLRRSELDVDERLDLAALGLAVASASGGDASVSAVERDALVAVQDVLGVDATEAARQLLASGRPAAQHYRSEATFNVAALQDFLDQPEAGIRNRVREILCRDEFRYLEEPTRAEYRERTFDWLKLLGDEGLGSLSYPKAYGGAGDTAAFMAAFESLAMGDLSLLIKFGVQFGLFGSSVHQLGTEQHHRDILPRAGSVELPGCFAMTETGHGSNVADIETRAIFNRDRDSFTVSTPHPGAMKNYIGNAACHGQMATVFVQLEVLGHSYGVHAILVPIRDEEGNPLPGITIEDDGLKLGLNGVDNGRLAFDEVEVPRTNLLDRFAQVSPEGEYSSSIASPSARFFTMLGTLVGGRVSVAASGNTAAKSALSIAIRYANRRRQFGPPGEPEFTLLDYLSHQERLLPKLAKTYAAHFALRDLGRSYAAAMQDGEMVSGEGPDDATAEQQGEARRELEGRAAALKAFATWHATDTIQECREACGGQGYLAENRFAALKADSDIFTTFEGDNTVLLQLVAKGLLSEYQKQFHAMSFSRAVRYAAHRVGSKLKELTPSLPGATDSATLRERSYCADLFQYREQHLLESLALRIKKRLDAGQDSSRAILDVQDHMIELARAHADRVVYESFCDAIDQAPADAVAALETLCALFGLSTVEEGRGWFLEHNALEPRATKAVRKEVNALLGELRPQAEHLVTAFGIPPELLAAPIAD